MHSTPVTTPSLASPSGAVLRQHRFTGLPAGTRIETDDGSVLQLHASYPDSNTCSFRVFVALEPIQDPRESDQHALIVHSVAVDSEGQWWQVSQTIDKHAMFGKLFFAERVVNTAHSEFSKDWTPADFTPPRARAVTPPLRVMYDGREDLWLEVLDRLPIARSDRPEYECHVFRLRMKYFSMDVQVFEDVVRRRTNGTEYMVPGLTALVTPHVDADSIVTLLPGNVRCLNPQQSLLNLAPFLSFPSVIEVNWRDAASSKPRPANADQWKITLRNAGTTDAEIEAFAAPNPKIEFLRRK